VSRFCVYPCCVSLLNSISTVYRHVLGLVPPPHRSPLVFQPSLKFFEAFACVCGCSLFFLPIFSPVPLFFPRKVGFPRCRFPSAYPDPRRIFSFSSDRMLDSVTSRAARCLRFLEVFFYFASCLFLVLLRDDVPPPNCQTTFSFRVVACFFVTFFF